MRLSLRSSLPRTVVMLAVSAFFVAVGFGVMIPVLPLFAASFGVTNFLIGLVVSAFAGMRLAMSPFVRRISDRVGHRRTIGIGMWVVGGSSALCGLAGSYGELLAWRAVGGLGSAMFTISATALLLASVGPELRGRASGLYQGGFLLGGMTGPAIGGLLAGVSLTAPFYFYAGTLVIAGTIAFTQLHDPPGMAEATAAAPTRSLAEVARDTRFRAACLLSFGTGWQSFGVRSALVPILVVSYLGAHPSWTGIAFAIAAVAQTLALQPAGRATDLIGRRPVMVAGGLLAAASTLATPFAPNLPVLVVLLCVYGVASAALGTAPTAALGDAAKDAGSQPVAIFSMIGDSGAILGPLVAGLLADHLGMPAAFGAGAAILLAGALLSWSIPARLDRPEPVRAR
ncbi:MFS transporter [Micropruina sp.]|uniref:MFS transporter n=1 Tax=Micropruina sp. TaxID=2737536 RepID=UPI0039E4E47F